MACSLTIKFEKNPPRGTKIMLCGHGLNFFHYYSRGTSSQTGIDFLCLKGIAKALTVDLLRLNIVSGIKTTFSTPS